MVPLWDRTSDRCHVAGVKERGWGWGAGASGVPGVVPPGWHSRVTFAVLSAGVAAYALLQSLVVPVLTTVQAQLHTSQATAT